MMFFRGRKSVVVFVRKEYKVMHLIQPKDAGSGNQIQYLEGTCEMMELSTVIEYNNAEYLEMGENRSRS
jgi:uncharacterized protein (UPF0179 family)